MRRAFFSKAQYLVNKTFIHVNLVFSSHQRQYSKLITIYYEGDVFWMLTLICVCFYCGVKSLKKNKFQIERDSSFSSFSDWIFFSSFPDLWDWDWLWKIHEDQWYPLEYWSVILSKTSRMNWSRYTAKTPIETRILLSCSLTNKIVFIWNLFEKYFFCRCFYIFFISRW